MKFGMVTHTVSPNYNGLLNFELIRWRTASIVQI